MAEKISNTNVSQQLLEARSGLIIYLYLIFRCKYGISGVGDILRPDCKIFQSTLRQNGRVERERGQKSIILYIKQFKNGASRREHAKKKIIQKEYISAG